MARPEVLTREVERVRREGVKYIKMEKKGRMEERDRKKEEREINKRL